MATRGVHCSISLSYHNILTALEIDYDVIGSIVGWCDYYVLGVLLNITHFLYNNQRGGGWAGTNVTYLLSFNNVYLSSGFKQQQQQQQTPTTPLDRRMR